MNFEEMKKIWDDQNNKPMFAIDQDALFRIVKAKIKNTNWSVAVTEIGLILVNFMVISVFIYKGFDNGNNWSRILTAIVAFLVSVFILIKRIRRKKQEKRFDRSLLGDLDYAILNSEYLINLARSFVWWYLLPFGLTIGLKAYYKFESKTTLEWIILVVMFLLAFMVTQWGLRTGHIPRKRALESLKRTLTQEK